MSLDKTEKLIDSISDESPMLNYLFSKGLKFDKEHRSYHLICCEERSETNPYCCKHGLMDLSVESWQEDSFQIVSVCFYFVQNGDMMRDPDIVFRYNKLTDKHNIEPMEIPISYQLDSMGIYNEVYQGDKINIGLLKELQEMLKTTVEHCKSFDYKVREDLKK